MRVNYCDNFRDFFLQKWVIELHSTVIPMLYTSALADRQ